MRAIHTFRYLKHYIQNIQVKYMFQLQNTKRSLNILLPIQSLSGYIIIIIPIIIVTININ
jgi:hypothetical protein